MKTIKQALLDEIHWPLPIGFVENKLIERELNGDDDYTPEVFKSAQWKGCLADCLLSLLQSFSLSEAGKSIGSLSDKDKERLLVRIKSLYKEIGEEPALGEPTVYIG